jgi:ATP-dependent Clp protease ATP-binding subunit ClpA
MQHASCAHVLCRQVIGATTLDEHRKYIERDPALERRFQPVQIDEPSPEATLQILTVSELSPHHGTNTLLC